LCSFSKETKKRKLWKSKWKILEGHYRRLPEKKQKTTQSPEEQARTKKQRQEALLQRLQERRLRDEMVVKSCLLKHIKDPYKQKLREAIRNRVDSYSRSVRKASLGLMRMARDIYRHVTGIKTVAVPEDFFGKTFIPHLILGTGKRRRKMRESTPPRKLRGIPLRGHTVQG